MKSEFFLFISLVLRLQMIVLLNLILSNVSQLFEVAVTFLISLSSPSYFNILSIFSHPKTLSSPMSSSTSFHFHLTSSFSVYQVLLRLLEM